MRIYEPKLEVTHLCPIRKEKASKFWPVLAFLNIEFCEFNSDDCCLCFELKKQFKDKTNLTWKEVFESESFPTLCCREHKNKQAIYEPLIYTVNKESRSKRGVFSNIIISNICKNQKTLKLKFFFPGLFLYIYIYIHTYIYTYIYIYIHIYIYIYV